MSTDERLRGVAEKLVVLDDASTDLGGWTAIFWLFLFSSMGGGFAAAKGPDQINVSAWYWVVCGVISIVLCTVALTSSFRRTKASALENTVEMLEWLSRGSSEEVVLATAQAELSEREVYRCEELNDVRNPFGRLMREARLWRTFDQFVSEDVLSRAAGGAMKAGTLGELGTAMRDRARIATQHEATVFGGPAHNTYLYDKECLDVMEVVLRDMTERREFSAKAFRTGVRRGLLV